ncbi:MAG: hypothetical protein J7L94_07435 [Caldisericaceae bacterium]|nr:hypothetical protein [Caldisericaceae bacterium]
MIKSGRAWLFC